MSLAAIQIIITACQIGSMGMGGNYGFEDTILKHHETMLTRTMKKQRQCQIDLLICMRAKPPSGGDLTTCLIRTKQWSE